MQDEELNLEELEAEIALFHRRIKHAKNTPAYHADPEVRRLTAKLERHVSELEDAVAARHAKELVREVEEDRLVGEAVDAYDKLRTAMITELLATPHDEQWINMASQIRAIERLHDQYIPANWEAIAHLLPVIE